MMTLSTLDPAHVPLTHNLDLHVKFRRRASPRFGVYRARMLRQLSNSV